MVYRPVINKKKVDVKKFVLTGKRLVKYMSWSQVKKRILIINVSLEQIQQHYRLNKGRIYCRAFVLDCISFR